MKIRSLTIGNIRSELQEQAPYIASQHSALWSEMVGNLLDRIERRCEARMSSQVWDEMHDYGMEQVRKHGLPCTHQHVGTTDSPRAYRCMDCGSDVVRA